MGRRTLRLSASLAGVALVTYAGFRLLALNATTQGFAYLLLILIIASGWGFFEASISSIAASLAFNFYFFEPIGTFTIADPRNWAALFTFLATSLIASRLSTEAKERALEALARQQDLERLYTFSRAILLIDNSEPFPKQLVHKLADVFELGSAVLYDRRSEEFYRAGPLEFEGLDEQLRDAALQGTVFADPEHNRVITAVRLGSEPIAGLALQGMRMPDAVLQGIANLVAIGLERARAQDLASQIEAARQSEKLRATLIDAMAHEFKTPLTSIKAATTALLADPNRSLESRTETIKIADEEAEHLTELIDNAVDMARLDTAEIHLQPEPGHIAELVNQVVASMRQRIEDRRVTVQNDESPVAIAVDHNLMKLAIKQLLDNALKYSPPDVPIDIHVYAGAGSVSIDVTDHGPGIPTQEQNRIFDRLYRSPSVQHQVTGSGLGLNIAHNIARAHHGDLTVASRPGETTFRLTLPLEPTGVRS
ncbi:MAG: integral rane sensor signal transduction histidine kinase [Bryobacterales bacterium]|nr:integral rane sensor signal transduction histidine kinase [Bryobacterales bacterium]